MIAYLGSVFTKLILKIIQRLPWNLLISGAHCLGCLGWWLDPVHRQLVLKNLRMALSEEPSPRKGKFLRTIGRESFIRMVENTLATVWMAGHCDRDLYPLIELVGIQEHLMPAVARKQGVIHVMFHLGNWELLSRIISRIPKVKFSTIYQPLKNPYFNQIVAKWRSQSGVGLINRHHGFNEAVRHLRRGEAVGMFVDQHAGDHGIWIPFFGRLASTTPLPAILARRTGATIIPIFCFDVSKNEERTSRNPKITPTPRWRVEFGVPIPSENRSDGEIMFEIHSRLEKVIRQDPANWFWLHNRWKTPSPNFLLKKYRRGVYIPPATSLKPFRVLVRSVNWLGDAILTIPALRAIRAGRPDCRLTILTPPKLADLWKGQSYVDEIFTSVSEVRKCPEFDAAVLFPNSLRSAFEVWRLGIPKRFGYAGHARRWFLTAVCPESFRATLHEHDVQDFCGLARWLGAKIESKIPSLDLPALRLTQNSKFKIQNSKIPNSYVVLHPGAAHGSAKHWLPERFVELVKLFPNQCWRLIGNPEERKRNTQLTKQMGSHVEDWTGQLNLTQLAEILAGARVIVCNDSGPMHLATAVGTPIVAIFGSTEPIHTGPLGQPGQKIRVLRHLVECSPCYLKECPVDLRCMKAISVNEVAEALREILSSEQ